MQRGDIEIRIRGARFADVDADKLGRMVSELAKLWPGTRLITVRANYFVLRPKSTETSCTPTTP